MKILMGFLFQQEVIDKESYERNLREIVKMSKMHLLLFIYLSKQEKNILSVL